MQFDSSIPIWTQLVTEFSRRIVVGSWPAGARLPGVRALAGEFGVNPNTVQRAMSELEREGLCRSERTAGRFITEDSSRIDQLRSSLAAQAADDFLDRARGVGMDRTQVQQLITERWDHHDPDHDDPTGREGT